MRDSDVGESEFREFDCMFAVLNFAERDLYLDSFSSLYLTVYPEFACIFVDECLDAVAASQLYFFAFYAFITLSAS